MQPIKLHNIEAEQALLGALFLDSSQLNQVSDLLRPEHFYDPIHGRIFHYMVTMHKKNLVVDVITVRTRFLNNDALNEVGGDSYLALLAETAADPDSSTDYALLIADMAARRNLVAITQATIKKAQEYQDLGDTEAIIGNLEKELQDITASGASLNTQTVGNMVSKYLEINEGKPVELLPTKIRDLDKITGKLVPGHLVVIGGRPSMGKTALAIQIAKNVAQAGHGVAFLSKEMDEADVAPRLLSNICKSELMPRISLEYQDIAQGNLIHEDYDVINNASKHLEDMPLIIDTTSTTPLSDVIASIKRIRVMMLRRGQKLKLAIIDHLGFIKVNTKYQTKSEAIGEVTKELKALAKNLGITIILLCQLSRAVEARDDKRPILPDLRDSGEIEQDADKVIFVYRDHYYLSKMTPKDKELEAHHAKLERTEKVLELLCHKNRGGRTGTVVVQCEIKYNYVYDTDKEVF